MCEGGEGILDTLKGVEQKKGEGNKDFKMGGELGQVVGALKKGRLEPPYKLWLFIKRKDVHETRLFIHVQQ